MQDFNENQFQTQYETHLDKLKNITTIKEGLQLLHTISSQCGIYTPVIYSTDDFPVGNEKFFNQYQYLDVIYDEFSQDGLCKIITNHIQTTLQTIHDNGEVADNGDGDGDNGENDQIDNSTITTRQGLELVHLIASKFKLFMPLIYTAADFPEVTKDFFNSNRSNLYDQMIKDSVGQQVENNIRSTLEELQYEDEAQGHDDMESILLPK